MTKGRERKRNKKHMQKLWGSFQKCQLFLTWSVTCNCNSSYFRQTKFSVGRGMERFCVSCR